MHKKYIGGIQMKAEFLGATYHAASTKEEQGNREKIQKYLNDGYYVKEERNGYWVLVKSARVMVTIGNGKTKRTFNMKRNICDYYGRARISSKLLERFQKDARSGKITFELDPENDSYIFY